MTVWYKKHLFKQRFPEKPFIKSLHVTEAIGIIRLCALRIGHRPISTGPYPRDNSRKYHYILYRYAQKVPGSSNGQ